MQWFEKIYKERFSNENISGLESNLDDIESDNLWANISESIPQEQPKHKAPFRWKVIGMIVFVSLLCFVLPLMNQDNTSEKSSAKNQQVDPNYSPKSDTESLTRVEEQIKPQSTVLIETFENKITTIESDKITINVKNNLSSSSEQKIKTHQIDPSHQISKVELAEISTSDKSNLTLQGSQNGQELNQPAKYDTNSNIQSVNNGELNHINTNPNFVASNIEKEFKSLSNNEKAVKVKDALEIEVPILKSRNLLSFEKLLLNWNESIKRYIPIPGVSPLTPKINIIKSPNPWSITLNSNINQFDQKYSDVNNTEEFADLANKSIQTLQFGYGYEMLLGYQLNNNWAISMGISRNQYESKLNTIITTDTIVLDSNQNLRNANNVRTVRWTNKLSTVTIPLNFSYAYNINPKLGLGTSIGLAYSFVASEKGKILGRENTILESSANPQFDNYLSFTIKPFIKYRLSDRFDMIVNIGLSTQNHGTSSVLNLNQRSLIYNAGAGIRYRLK